MCQNPGPYSTINKNLEPISKYSYPIISTDEQYHKKSPVAKSHIKQNTCISPNYQKESGKFQEKKMFIFIALYPRNPQEIIRRYFQMQLGKDLWSDILILLEITC
jgi:hypothetical protein